MNSREALQALLDGHDITEASRDLGSVYYLTMDSEGKIFCIYPEEGDRLPASWSESNQCYKRWKISNQPRGQSEDIIEGAFSHSSSLQ